MGSEWLNRYVSIEKETDFGEEPSGTQIFGEVDDESFKQTFDLLVRSDMSRQVASKAVTNTKYGEGSINFAVQPDDFMGWVLSSLLPVTVENAFYDRVDFAAVTNQNAANSAKAGYGYTETSNTWTIGGTTFGYWEVRNGGVGAIDGTWDASNSTLAQGVKIISLHSGAEATTFATQGGLAIGTGSEANDNIGYGIVGSPTTGNTTAGTYFTYRWVENYQLKGVTTYGDDSTFTTAADMTNVSDNTVCLGYENYNTGIEPGRIYAYVTSPSSGVSAGAVTLTGEASAQASVGGTAYGVATAQIGGASKHIFNEPVAAADVYPSFSIRVGREAKEHTFTGMVSTRLSLSANLNEYVMASVDWVGQAEETPGDIQEGVTFSGNDVDALHFSGAELYIDGSLNTSTKVQSITLEININRDIDSAYAVGANTIQRIPPSRTREITGSMEFNEIVYSDTTGIRGEPTYADLATSTTVHALHGGQGRPALLIKFQDQDDADHMEIQLYNVRFEAPEASVSGRDPARMSVNFQGFYDSKATGAAKAIQVKLKGTGLSTDAYA